MNRKVIIFAALAACLVGVARAGWVCSDSCVNNMGFEKIQHCGNNMPAQGNAGTVCAKNQEFHKTYPTTQVEPCKSGKCSRIACPASYCDTACSAEGVDKATGIDCYDDKNKMAETAEAANNKALAFGCHGSHQMDKQFMIGVDHKACDAAPIAYKDAGADTPVTGDKPKETLSPPPAKPTETLSPPPAKPKETLSPPPAKPTETLSPPPARSGPTTKKEEVEEKKQVLEDKKAAKAAEEANLKLKMEEKAAKEAEKKMKEETKKAKEAEKKMKEETKKQKEEMAKQKEDAMLAGIADADKLKEAKIAADAAKSNKTITKVKVSKTAANESAACNETFAAMSIAPSAGACTATAPSSRRLLLNTAYDVAILVNPVLVDDSTLATAIAAVNATTETANTTAILTSIPGVDMASVNAFLTAADESVQAEAELAAATTELAAAEAELATATTALAAAESEVAAIETTIATVNNEITAAEADVTAAEKAAAPAPAPPPPPAPKPKPTTDAGSGAQSVRATLVTTVFLAITLFLVA